MYTHTHEWLQQQQIAGRFASLLFMTLTRTNKTRIHLLKNKHNMNFFLFEYNFVFLFGDKKTDDLMEHTHSHKTKQFFYISEKIFSVFTWQIECAMF